MSTADERAEVQTDIEGKYHIKDSGSGTSWLIGTDDYQALNQLTYANGFVDGIDACPEYLVIPGNLTDKKGNTKPVEIIGSGAFSWCGCITSTTVKGRTKRLKVPRQVKVIKSYGIGVMYDLEVFEIEEETALETIERLGLYSIGLTTGKTSSKRIGILILPSTLSSVYRDGISECNLFHTIIYCGKHTLSNSSDLESGVSDTVVKVASKYPNSKIFNRNPNRGPDTEEELEIKCQGFLGPKPTDLFTNGKGYDPILASACYAFSLVSSLLPPDRLKNWDFSIFFFPPYV